MSDLAALEMVSRATMHHVIKGLEKDGLVKRLDDVNDARRQIIRLTRVGVAAIERAHKARIAYLSTLAADLDSEDLALTAKVMDSLRNNASPGIFP
jgi:DNA-binding MarR family transcriptional regulator